MNVNVKRLASLMLALVLLAALVVPGLETQAAALSYNGSASYKSGRFYTALTQVQLTGNQRTDIVNVAASQIGYQEGDSNSQISGHYRGDGDFTEYGRWYGMQDMWCAMFVSWCAGTAGVSTSVVPSHAYTPSGLTWFLNRGRAYSRATVASGGYVPQPGDIVYFKSSRNSNITNHVGIVTGYASGKLYTIEGNTSSATISTNGGAVCSKSYNITNTYIRYICSPNYSGTDINAGSTGTTTAPSLAENAVFNATYYAGKYPDLKDAFGSDTGALRNHYMEYGLPEGRSASPIFNVKYYLENNADLKQTYGTDLKSAYDHFLANGYKEIRNTAPAVDLGDKFYAKITNVGAGLNLSINSETGGVLTYHDTSSAAQTWQFIRQSDNSYKIVNKKTGNCLDLQGAVHTPGAKIQTYKDNGTNAQRWFIHEVTPGQYVLRAKCSSACVLNVVGGATTENAALQSASYNASNAQIFTITQVVDTSNAAAPTITNVKISNVNAEGYTVTCTVNSEAGVDRVLFPSWSKIGGQDDILWGSGSQDGSTYSYRVNIKEHDYDGGQYITHIYAYDINGKYSAVSTGASIDPRLQIKNVKITNISSSGYTVTCTATGGYGIRKVDFASWTYEGGQDDLIWSTPSQNGDTFSLRINTDDHNGEGGRYITHIYAYDNNGGKVSLAAADLTIDLNPVLTNVKISDVTADGYTVSCTATSGFGIRKVDVAAWSENDGKDDLVWGAAAKNGSTYTFRVKASAHGHDSGNYITHVYAYDNRGRTTVVPLNVTVNTALEIKSVTVTDVTSSGYTVNCTVTSSYGINKVDFATWTQAGGQDDLVWSAAGRNGDTFSLRINTDDHNGEGGRYITHIYAYDNNGAEAFAIGADLSISIAPVITDAKVTNITPDGFTVTCTATSGFGIQKVDVAAWTESNGQDDLVWGAATKNGNTFSFRVKVSDHGIQSGKYNAHIYAYDTRGNKSSVALTTNVNTAPRITNVKVTEIDGTGFTVSCTAIAGNGIDRVMFPTWTEKNGQDDLLWGTAAKNGDTYSFRVNIRDHKLEGGKYLTHIYAYDTNGKYAVTGVNTNLTLKLDSQMGVPLVDLGSDFYAKITPKVNLGLNLSLSDNDVITYGDSGMPAQIWRFLRQSDGSYKIVNCKNEMCLDVNGGTSASGTNVGIAADNGSDAQRWYIYETVNGFVLKAKCAMTCALDVPQASTEPMTSVRLYTCNGSAAQMFAINKVSGPTDTIQNGNQMEVIRKIIYAVETGGQVYGQADYTDFTPAFANSSIEYAITIGAGQWYGTEARRLLCLIRTTDPALFASLDTAGIGTDLDTLNWGSYRVSTGSAKAVCIQNIIGSDVGRACQDKLLDDQMAAYMKEAEALGVTDLAAQMMCANLRHQGGLGAMRRVLAKTKAPYTLDNIYAALQSDTGNQVGAYRARQRMVYNALKTYIN